MPEGCHFDPAYKSVQYESVFQQLGSDGSSPKKRSKRFETVVCNTVTCGRTSESRSGSTSVKEFLGKVSVFGWCKNAGPLNQIVSCNLVEAIGRVCDISWIMLWAHIMPLFWTSACPDSLYTVAYIDMKSAFLIVDIAKDHSTICVEGDLIEFDSNLCSDGFHHVHCQDSRAEFQTRYSVLWLWR